MRQSEGLGDVRNSESSQKKASCPEAIPAGEIPIKQPGGGRESMASPPRQRLFPDRAAEAWTAECRKARRWGQLSD